MKYFISLAYIPYSKMTTLYLAPTYMRAGRHQEPLISSLHLVIRILCNLICLFKGKGLETVKPNQSQSFSKTKLFGANYMQIGQ